MLSQSTQTAIKKLSYIVRIVVGFILGLYLSCLVFTASPPAQRWLAREASIVLSRELNTGVFLSNVYVGLFNRVVIDDLILRDQQSHTLLRAARLSAKIDVMALFKGQIRISNIQLFGYDIRLFRKDEQSPYNFQFILDRLASNDSTQRPLDLAISDIIIRRGTLSHDILSHPVQKRFNPDHLLLRGLSLRAQVSKVSGDSICASISQLKFTESRSGFTLKNFGCDIAVALPRTSPADSLRPLSARLNDLHIVLPHSELTIPDVSIAMTDSALTTASVALSGSLAPSDLSPFLPPLAPFTDAVRLEAAGQLADGTFRFGQLSLASKSMQFDADGSLVPGTEALFGKDAQAAVNIGRFHVDSILLGRVLGVLAEEKVLAPEMGKMFARMGSIALTGEAAYSPSLATADLHLLTGIGKANVRASLAQRDIFDLHVQTEDVRLAHLLAGEQPFPLDHLTVNAETRGSLNARTADVQLETRDVLFKGEKLEHFAADVAITPHTLKATAELNDPEYAFRLSTDLTSERTFSPDSLLLNSLQGHLLVNDLHLRLPDKHYDLERLRLSVLNNETGRHLDVKSDFMEARADGRFTYADLARTAQRLLHTALPSLIPSAPAASDDCRAHFSLQVADADTLFAATGIDLQLPAPAYVEGLIDGGTSTLAVNADLPHVIYGSEELRNASIVAHQEADSITLLAELQRIMDSEPVSLSLSAQCASDRLHATLSWDDHGSPAQRGQLATLTRFERDTDGRLQAHLHLHPSQLVIADTIWDVHDADISFKGSTIAVDGVRITQMQRHLVANGQISPSPSDTLWADLRGINLAYVFDLVGFDDVSFAGRATGRVAAHGLMQRPTVDARLSVSDFTLNGGLLGQLQVEGGFGRKDDRAIDLDAYIEEPIRHRVSHVTALIKPGHEPGRGMELNIWANYLNAYFINDFTSDIFTDLQGRVSGYTRLYGPFKRLDLDGNLAIDTLAVTIDALGTRYHTAGGDSLRLRPEGIFMHDVRLLDAHHGTDRRQHSADLSGGVRFRHFKDLSYDFDVRLHDFLGYDFRDFGDQTFYGTVFADGNVHLSGQSGQLNVDLDGQPTAGTVFTYNVATPESLTDNGFITFKSARPTTSRTNAYSYGSTDGLPPGDSKPHSPTEEQGEEPDDPTDIRINFNLDITPKATMRLLMDNRSGDDITIHGNGNIKASFYNKGHFQMYGTYRVADGTYRLSIQDVIRKDFQFERGGSITFGGAPLKADLNLRAIHTVPSVSLNGLAAGANFSNSAVRVNCLMNIAGQAGQPRISFDFDIPNVNEDEKRMVRAMISTEEERNMQVIYLLGIGRFYTYGLDADQNQTNTAMNSLLSSTLSGQVNELLSNAIGSRNWNFGTNIATGQTGWSDIDVEGMLSGRLFNDRLLINGTFGYRDTPVANTNFIGDFDVQYLLTPSGTISLKAYSETNDRYFTKSALTTQGIGIQLRKDFNSFREIFRRKR